MADATPSASHEDDFRSVSPLAYPRDPTNRSMPTTTNQKQKPRYRIKRKAAEISIIDLIMTDFNECTRGLVEPPNNRRSVFCRVGA